MITVKNLTKMYGKRKVLDNVSFTIHTKTATGILGPNGAGKTTALRILASFILPDSGSISINGCDPVRSPLAARRMIGYLPETLSLYREMKAADYLRYRGRLKGLSRRRLKKNIERVIAQCHIEENIDTVIRNLSKGYTQRLGLADVLLTEPPVLILDEPTSGLDPNQIVEFRKLITALQNRHTILIATHILREVEILCNTVIIFNTGKIVIQKLKTTPVSLEEIYLQSTSSSS